PSATRVGLPCGIILADHAFGGVLCRRATRTGGIRGGGRISAALRGAQLILRQERPHRDADRQDDCHDGGAREQAPGSPDIGPVILCHRRSSATPETKKGAGLSGVPKSASLREAFRVVESGSGTCNRNDPANAALHATA